MSGADYQRQLNPQYPDRADLQPTPRSIRQPHRSPFGEPRVDDPDAAACRLLLRDSLRTL